MKKIRERFSLSANKAGFILACTLIPFSMLNGAAQSSTGTSGTEVKDVVAELKDSETIVLPPQAAGTKEPVEFHAADKEPAEKKNIYENAGKEQADFASDSAEAATREQKTETESTSTQAPAQSAAPSGQTTTIVEPPYTTTKVTTETITTKTVTTETRTTESSITSGPGLPAEKKVDGPLAPVQEKHSWDTPSSRPAPATPKANTQPKKESEKKQEPEANLKIKETEPKKKPEAKQPAKQPAKTEAKPATPKAQTTKPAAKQPEKKTEAKPAPKPAPATPKPTQPKKESAPASNNQTAKPAPVTTEKEASPAPKESQKEQKATPIAPVDDEKPSRSVTVKNSQYLDVIYPGSVWIYLGEKDANDLMRYYGRKVSPDGEETKFTLKATKSGSTVLHFYKNDALAGKFIEDYLAVTVSTETERDTHVSAPNYADYVPKGQRGKNIPSEESAPKATEAVTERPAQAESKASPKIAASSSTGTSIERSSSSSAQVQEQRPSSQNQAAKAASGDLLKKAQSEYDAKQYAECLATLQEFYKNADESKMDQALYLEGRALEAPSPSRNIKSALQTYKTLVNRYPQSSLWEAANNRITYIQRMYIDIR